MSFSRCSVQFGKDFELGRRFKPRCLPFGRTARNKHAEAHIKDSGKTEDAIQKPRLKNVSLVCSSSGKAGNGGTRPFHMSHVPESARRNLALARANGRIRLWRSAIETEIVKQLIWHCGGKLSQPTLARELGVACLAPSVLPQRQRAVRFYCKSRNPRVS